MKVNFQWLKKDFDGPVYFLAITAFSIFIAELVAMLFINLGGFGFPPAIIGLIDATFITLVLVPELFLFIYRPMRQYIYDKNKSEDELTLSEERYKKVINNLSIGVILLGPQREILSYNNQAENWFPQLKLQNLTCNQIFRECTKESCIDCPTQRTLLDGGNHEKIYTMKVSNQIMYLRMVSSPLMDEQAGIISIILTLEDFTKRKIVEDKTETSLQESEDKYRSLVKQSSEGIFIFNPITHKILDANERFLNFLGYDYQEITQMRLEDIALLDKETIDKNIDRLLKENNVIIGIRQYKRKNNSIVHGEASISLIRYGSSKVVLVNVRDITERLKAEEDQKLSFQNLKRTLEETVNALVAVSEKRDPYTAGHQHRVAGLAKAIAKAMGLPENIQEGIYVAGKLHDLGKMYVPVDILNKPGNLDQLELSFIRQHAQEGYDILQRIPFECPVAEMVLQHHERPDGSGYPRGLTNKNILLEAKILGVADVVEAMASHRPYRPAIGLHQALEEISRNKGSLYHAEVAEACLKLFETGEFTFDMNKGTAWSA